MRNSFQLILLVLTISYSNSMLFNDVEMDKPSYLSSKEAWKMLNELLKEPKHHHHHHRHKGYCGVKAVKKLKQICPDLCSNVDDNLLMEMCSKNLTDDDILQRCCPE
ncbi:INSulin related [Caenorhabditis elegans]|uniref:INSulin related n=1 Tax=Caenorhabditis elegans TaxID=6239 RepID=Q7JPJ3_CAEEL|nr:INSulin related [Caenorhabditis elegans]CCD73330.2 INSulin related [Caenorhabditis elegans]|eukprot:NP_001022529.2 INSulin related [Caenorhabditis elegans]